MHYPRPVLPIYLEEKEDQSSYLERSKPYKKSHHLMAFSLKNYFINLVTMVEAR